MTLSTGDIVAVALPQGGEALAVVVAVNRERCSRQICGYRVRWLPAQDGYQRCSYDLAGYPHTPVESTLPVEPDPTLTRGSFPVPGKWRYTVTVPTLFPMKALMG